VSHCAYPNDLLCPLTKRLFFLLFRLVFWHFRLAQSNDLCELRIANTKRKAQTFAQTTKRSLDWLASISLAHSLSLLSLSISLSLSYSHSVCHSISLFYCLLHLRMQACAQYCDDCFSGASASEVRRRCRVERNVKSGEANRRHELPKTNETFSRNAGLENANLLAFNFKVRQKEKQRQRGRVRERK